MANIMAIILVKSQFISVIDIQFDSQYILAQGDLVWVGQGTVSLKRTPFARG